MSWNAFGRVAGVTGFAETVTTGTSKVVGQIYTSPGSSLTEDWDMIEKIQQLLDGLSKTRRQRIDEAAAKGHGKSIAAIELEFEGIRDRYWILYSLYQKSFLERYLPSGSFRKRIDLLHSDIKSLLLDTVDTTVSVLTDEERAALENPARKPLRSSANVPPARPETADAALPDSPTTPSAPGSFEDISLNTGGSSIV